MDQAPLVIDDIEAGVAFLKEMNRHRPVLGGAWVRADEDSERYPHVVLDGLTKENKDEAYREVLRITIQLKDKHYIDPFQVKVIGPGDPVAKAILDTYRRYPGRSPTRPSGGALGSQGVAEVYIYPLSAIRP
jgi:hypothetical protein